MKKNENQIINGGGQTPASVLCSGLLLSLNQAVITACCDFERRLVIRQLLLFVDIRYAARVIRMVRRSGVT